MAFSFAATVAIMVCFSLVFMTGVLGNLCILATIWTSSRLKKSLSNILISDLALADLFLCLISAPYYLSSLAIADPPQPGSSSLHSLCKGFVVSGYSLGFTRILLLAIISLERYIAIIHPFFYQKHCFSSLSRGRLACVCGYAWIHSYLCTTPAAYMENWIKYVGKAANLCSYSWDNANLGFVLPLFVMNFLLPLCIIVFTNCKVYITARRQRRRIAAASCTVSTFSDMPLSTVINDWSPRRTNNEKRTTQQGHLSSVKTASSNVGNKGPAIVKSLDIFTVSYDKVRDCTSHKQDNCDLDSAFSELCSEHAVLANSEGCLIRESNIQHENSLTPSLKTMGFLTADKSLNNTETSSLTDGKQTVRDRVSISSRPGDSGFKETNGVSYNEISTSTQYRYKTVREVNEVNKNNNSDYSTTKKNSRFRFLTSPSNRISHNMRRTNVQDRRKDFVMFFSTLSVVTLFLCTWLPFAIMSIGFLATGTVISEKADTFVSMITVIDSAFTPLIVFGTRREFRRMLLKKLFRQS